MAGIRSGVQPRCLTVLFFDGHDDTRQAYVESARAAGIHAVMASDGDEALARAILLVPDVVVTAVRLVGMDGFELARRLKYATMTRRIAVIVLTGLVSPDLSERAKDAGCAAVLSKPCSFEELERTIARVTKEGRPHAERHG